MCWNEKSSYHIRGCPQWRRDPGIPERCGSVEEGKHKLPSLHTDTDRWWESVNYTQMLIKKWCKCLQHFVKNNFDFKLYEKHIC